MKYMACLVMLLTVFAACSPDSDASDPGSITNKTYTLHFNLSPVSGSSASSRAETYTAGSPNSWEDGSKEENMKSWTVVFVKSDGTVAKVVKQPSVAEGKDKEDDVTVTGLEAGTYSVYSFANISDTELGTITEGSPSPDFDSQSFAVNGNDMDIKAKGIPMSNKQEVTIGSDGKPNITDLYVGMIGRLSPQKAPDVFIRAAKLIHDEIPNSAFIIVGSGEEEEEVKAFAKENGLNLIVTGWTDEPYSYLKVFDVAMLLSRWEGFGLAVVEYMAAEKNVVATKIDAIPTLVDDGVDGLLVEMDNPKDAAEKVLWLYRHPKEAVEMKSKALKKVTENYDIKRVVDQHMEMFNNLITGGDKM